jgi:lysine 2,3-aminomutase
MDLVGNPTATIEKHKFGVAREDLLTAMLDYPRRSPGVRGVVVSGGDVANPPWQRLEARSRGVSIAIHTHVNGATALELVR